MINYAFAFLTLFFLVKEGICCGCGCNRPSNFGLSSYDDLGVKVCGVEDIPPLEINKPLCPPPPSLCKELGIGPQAPFFPAPPACSRGAWLPYLPKCLRKQIRHPFCIHAANVLHQKIALNQLRVYGPGFNLSPLGSGCGCGCGL